MKTVEKYLARQSVLLPDLQRSCSSETEIIVVIPAYKEEFNTIEKTLISLLKQKSYTFNVEVLLLVNEGIWDDERTKNINRSCLELARNRAENYSRDHAQFYVLYHQFENKKKSGVGSARKLLMDLATERFLKISKNGIIVNLDADTTVDENYFIEIFNAFKNKDIEAGGIHFEHKLTEKLNSGTIEAILEYELHLRYFINIQRHFKLPFAYQTIGSAMITRMLSYVKESGMVRNQAGEDFYFLHKFIRKGSFRDINTTTVFPSGRTSDRVPFGTGKAVLEHLHSTSRQRKTYNFKSFYLLSSFLKVNHLFQFSEEELEQYIENQDLPIRTFLLSISAVQRIIEIKKNTTDFPSFYKRFYRWFDAFVLMKYLHFVRAYQLDDIELNMALKHLFQILNLEFDNDDNVLNLEMLRKFDRSRNYTNEVQLSIPNC